MEGLQTILRLPRVIEVCGYSKSRIYALIKENTFPRPVPLAGGGAVGWLESELIEWQRARVAERTAGAARRAPTRVSEHVPKPRPKKRAKRRKH
jgi:prophage regulatory protein